MNDITKRKDMNSLEIICQFLKNYKNEKEKRFCEICNELKKFKNKKDEMRLRGFNNFNYIELLKGFDDENTHSKIIAEFLNPNGSHFQGSIFIENFFEVLNLKYNLQNWNVITEKFMSNYVDKGQGRIDVFLTDGKRYIILENKIKANDQPSQIYKYVEGLYKEIQIKDRNKILVLYLTKNGIKPSKESLNDYKIKNDYLELNNQQKAKIKCISYEDILKWMKKNLSTVENISNLRESIKQYIKIIKKLLQKEKNIMNLKEYLLKDKNKDILITLIENKEEFDNFIKNNEECKKIIKKEELYKIINEIIDKINDDLLKKIKNIFQDNLLISDNNSKYLKYLKIRKENKYIEIGWPYNFNSKHSFKELALKVLKKGEDFVIEYYKKVST